MIAGVVTIASAPAASAASIGLTANCTDATGMVVLALEASRGTSITITPTNCGRAQIDGPGIDPLRFFDAPVPDGSWPSPVVFVVRSDAPLGETPSGFNFGVQRNGDLTARLWHLTIVAGPDPAPGAETTPIPEWFQAYGRSSANEACLEGWTASWAEWMSAGTGGFVCERSIPAVG